MRFDKSSFLSMFRTYQSVSSSHLEGFGPACNRRLSSPTLPRRVLARLGLAELRAKHSDLVDQLSDHLRPHRFFAPEPVGVVKRSEPLLGQPARVRHN